MSYSIRKATLDDIPALKRLIATSVRTLGSDDYTPEQIEAALGSAWGVDSGLISDETYFVVELNGVLAACGGWGKRKTLFGADGHSSQMSELLDPAVDAARIRAFFVHPDFARRGIGRALLELCETEARAYGFKSAQLVATLPGRRLYQAHGYVGDEPREYPLPNGLTITFVPMTKRIAP